MQDMTLHPDWSAHYDMGNTSLLDIYGAFAASDLSFRIPLLVNQAPQTISVAALLQYDLPELYMQVVQGLADFRQEACRDPGSAEARLFSKAACQGMAILACLLETPRQVAKLADAHLMKKQSDSQQGVSGVDVMMRLDKEVTG